MYNTTWYTSIIIIPTSENSVDHLYTYHHDFYHLFPLLTKNSILKAPHYYSTTNQDHITLLLTASPQCLFSQCIIQSHITSIT